MPESLLTLANDRIRLRVAPDFGARITELVDLGSGRNWLVKGSLSGSAGNEASYLGDEARGWDECFPTIAPCIHPGWEKPLRDHGEIWGRPCACEQAGDTIKSSIRIADCVFQRSLSLEGELVRVRYQVDNQSDVARPYLWSQHCLLAIREGDQLQLEGLGALQVTSASGLAKSLEQSFVWPRLNAAIPDLRDPQAHASGWACKAYADVDGICRAGIRSASESISLCWPSQEVAFVGLWLNYGAWPESRPVDQIAFEPTSAPADDLCSAEKAGHVRVLAPGERHEWAMTIEMTQHTATDTRP